jgi:hypothetical protein
MGVSLPATALVDQMLSSLDRYGHGGEDHSGDPDSHRGTGGSQDRGEPMSDAR